MKAHSSGGDKGKTSLLSGERVAKTHRRIEACGEVDELNCTLGTLAAALAPAESGLRDELAGIQGDLFTVGSWLATAPGSAAARLLPSFPVERTRRLEQGIERLETGLPSLQGFVLPGGHPTAALAHAARAVCRRAERRVVAIVMDPEENAAGSLDAVTAFLNRLSNYLFAVARYCNNANGVPERTWQS